jgi:hypothetical protein
MQSSIARSRFFHIISMVALATSCATVTTIAVSDPRLSVPTDEAERAEAVTGYVIFVGANPYRLVSNSDGTIKQEPVGIVTQNDQVIAGPEPPYWAIGGASETDLQIFPQEKVPLDLQWAVGGFYPLLLDGHTVADRFPGRSIRAARVAIAWRQTEDQNPKDVMIVVSTGSMPWYRGMTTGELAELLLEAGMRNALNLDGGRASAVYIDSGAGHQRRPRNIFATPPGPVMLQVYGSDGNWITVPAKVIRRNGVDR